MTNRDPNSSLKKYIDHARKYVEDYHKDDTTGHDYYHILRVAKLTRFIAVREGADVEIATLAAWLHDLDDWKIKNETESGTFPRTTQWMNKVKLPLSVRKIIFDIIENLSFKGGTVPSVQNTLEGKIVQDADRLDAMGAIGIARTFAFGGSHSRPIYLPHIKPHDYHTFEEYKSMQNHTINHFHEKLLLLKDKMNTKTAKIIAKERHNKLEAFLNDFYKEWNSDDYCQFFPNY